LGGSEEILEYHKSLRTRLTGQIQDKSKDLMQGKLKRLRDAVKQRWEALTDKDLGMVDGRQDQLTGQLQA